MEKVYEYMYVYSFKKKKNTAAASSLGDKTDHCNQRTCMFVDSKNISLVKQDLQPLNI